MHRPELDRLIPSLQAGDTLVITKLDRIARTAAQGSTLIDGLLQQNISIHVLNMGLMDNSPTGKLIRHILFAFAEFERDMIVERTQEGRQIARLRPDYREGRPGYPRRRIELALALLETSTYKEVEASTGISKSTLQRWKRKYELMEDSHEYTNNLSNQ